MDFGVQLYDRTVERELTLTNSGKVPFDFAISMARLSRPGIVEAIPAAGHIPPLGKEVIRLRVSWAAALTGVSSAAALATHAGARSWQFMRRPWHPHV
jgi:hypothetical protein